MEAPLKRERDLENEEAGLALDLDPQAGVILFAFGGFLGRLGRVPVFEFFNVASLFGVKKAFVRDLNQCWYHRGVIGVGADIPAVADHLTGIVAKIGASRTVLIGNSAGAYAALLFGHLLNADEVHAFSPQTFIDPEIRTRHRDERWQPALDRLFAADGFDERFGDLLPVLSQGGVKTAFHIYYPKSHRLDRLHGSRMAEVPGVVPHALDGGGHDLVKLLRDSGELTCILERALAPGGTL